jgi:CHAD domain-containing protein
MNSPRKWSRPGIAAGAGTGEAFISNVRAALEQVDINAAGAAEGRDPEYLHQLRIGLRRLRSTLRAFHSLLRRRKSAEFDQVLREILRALGAARDWDVFRLSHHDSGLVRAAQRRSTGARRRARDMLHSARFRITLRSMLAWVKAGPWRSGADPDKPVATFARGALRRLQKSLREDAEGIDWSNAAHRHRVRVKAKRLRYGYDCFAAVYQMRDARSYLIRLRKLQQVLGEMNDITIQRAQLQELARDARLRGLAATLRASLVAREHELIGEVTRVWSDLEATKPFWRRAAPFRAKGSL